MKNLNFREKLKRRQKKVNSLVCLGLDPLPEKLPDCIKTEFGYGFEQREIILWMIDIVEATTPYISMIKLQKAHYEALKNGNLILHDIICYIHRFHPDIPVFLDCKRGDIGRTQQRYRVAHFEIDRADGINFNPYMGKDCMEALFDPKHPGRAIVGLCYTSNPSAREIQDVKLNDGRFYWEFIAETIHRWAFEIGINKNAGLVMAAAYENPKGSGKIFSRHLSHAREIVGNDLWFLIPGIGTQGGFVEETVKAAYTGPGSIAINSSSGIIFASSGDDYAEAAGKKAKKLRGQIRKTGGNIF